MAAVNTYPEGVNAMNIEKEILDLLPLRSIGKESPMEAMLINALERIREGDLASAYWILHAFMLGIKFREVMTQHSFFNRNDMIREMEDVRGKIHTINLELMQLIQRM